MKICDLNENQSKMHFTICGWWAHELFMRQVLDYSAGNQNVNTPDSRYHVDCNLHIVFNRDVLQRELNMIWLSIYVYRNYLASGGGGGGHCSKLKSIWFWNSLYNLIYLHLLRDCSCVRMYGGATKLHSWEVIIGTAHGLVPSGDRPLPERMLTEIDVFHIASLSHTELTCLCVSMFVSSNLEWIVCSCINSSYF